MVKVQFFPMDISYKGIDEKPVIHLFGRTKSGDQIIVLDDSFSPYFYAEPKKASDIEGFIEKTKNLRIEKDGEVAVLTGTEVVKKKYRGKEFQMIKIFTQQPKDIAVINEEIKTLVNSTHETDIPFVRRYLVDKNITAMTVVEAEGEYINFKSKVSVLQAKSVNQVSEETIKEPKVLAFDIETYSPFGKQIIPEQNPILMIAFYGNGFKKVITWKKFKTRLDFIEFVESEEELIKKFKEVLEDFKPDIITGYYSDGFDFPYIKARADKLGIELSLGIEYSELSISKRAGTARITGIVHLDVFKFIKRVLGMTMDTQRYGLGAVAKELLNEQKYDVEIDELSATWDQNPEELEKFCKYNLNDAALTFRICEKIFPNIIELVKILGLPIYDINRMGFSQLVESYIIKQSRSFNELIPKKPSYEESRERLKQTYKGAYVFEPKPGLYKEIVVFDFRSLYPTIISSHNISTDTINCSCCRGSADLAPVEDGKYWFCKKRKGFIPSIIEDLITRRMRIKEIMKSKSDESFPILNARQNSLKLLSNSFYGYLAFFGARWYCIECAISVTGWGRFYIQKVIESAKKHEFNVIYSDTDSVLMTLGKKTKDDAVKFSEEVNRKLPGLMELEFEGMYPFGLFVSAKVGAYGAKKKYALISSKGTIKIVGFETVRRNWSIIAKEVQERVIEIILKERNPEKALRHVRAVIDDLKNSKIPVERVVIHTQLQKDIGDYDSIGPHVKVAMRMKNKNIPVGPGSVIKFVVVRGKGTIGDRARLPGEVSQDEYDPEYYINNQIIPSVERIFNVLGFKKEELLEEKDQSKLDKFI